MANTPNAPKKSTPDAARERILARLTTDELAREQAALDEAQRASDEAARLDAFEKEVAAESDRVDAMEAELAPLVARAAELLRQAHEAAVAAQRHGEAVLGADGALLRRAEQLPTHRRPAALVGRSLDWRNDNRKRRPCMGQYVQAAIAKAAGQGAVFELREVLAAFF